MISEHGPLRGGGGAEFVEDLLGLDAHFGLVVAGEAFEVGADLRVSEDGEGHDRVNAHVFVWIGAQRLEQGESLRAGKELEPPRQVPAY